MSLISNHDDKFKTVIRNKNNNGNKKKYKPNKPIFLCKCCEIKDKFNSNKPLSKNLKSQFKIKDILIKIFSDKDFITFSKQLYENNIIGYQRFCVSCGCSIKIEEQMFQQYLLWIYYNFKFYKKRFEYQFRLIRQLKKLCANHYKLLKRSNSTIIVTHHIFDLLSKFKDNTYIKFNISKNNPDDGHGFEFKLKMEEISFENCSNF